jgi:4-hydroxy-tetrahydrodipicolinate synthase
MMKLKGTVTAMITPFNGDEIDEDGLITNIHYQIEQGINGILVLGSTGEAPTLSPDEQTHVISIAVREAKKKLPIWVGTGTYCTKKTIENTNKAKDLGADVALIVTPYYNKPTQEGIFRHFEAIATKVEMPIVVYNIQARCGINIETSTLARIAGLPNVIGVKEASGNVSQVGDVIQAVIQNYPDFLIFSGDDILTLPMMVLGAHGVISVASNLVPSQVDSLVSAALDGDFASAKEIHHRLLPLFKAIFLETNPIPIKAAMNICGMPSGKCRLPLVELASDNFNTLQQLLSRMQLMAQTS